MEQLNTPNLLGTANTAFLGVSTKTLRRYRDLEGGFLIQDKDWFFGAYDNSPIRWDLERCKKSEEKRIFQICGLPICQKNHRGTTKKMTPKNLEVNNALSTDIVPKDERHLHLVQMALALNRFQ